MPRPPHPTSPTLISSLPNVGKKGAAASAADAWTNVRLVMVFMRSSGEVRAIGHDAEPEERAVAQPPRALGNLGVGLVPRLGERLAGGARRLGRSSRYEPPHVVAPSSAVMHHSATLPCMS